MLFTFRETQKKALGCLSHYAIEVNNIYQKEIHHNIDMLNFSNSRLFSSNEPKTTENRLLTSEMLGDTEVDT